MRPVVLALAVLLAAPLAAAQTEAPAPVATPEATPGENVLAPIRVTAELPSPSAWQTRAPRIFVNALLVPVGGTVGGLAGGLVGFGIGLAANPSCGLFSGSSTCIWTGLAGLAIGAVLVTPATALLVGHFMGGRGHYGWTLLGSFGGAVVGSTLTFALASATGGASWSPAALYLCATAGTILTYELSSHAASTSDRPSAQRVQLLPVAGRALGGETTLGLVGVF